MGKIDPAVEMLHRQMEHDKLYGEVTVKYENGRAVLMKKTETIKPSSDRDNRGGEDE